MSDELVNELYVSAESAAIGFTKWASLMRMAACEIERLNKLVAGLDPFFEEDMMDSSNVADLVRRLRNATPYGLEDASVLGDASDGLVSLVADRDRWQATAAGLSQDISNAEDEIERLRIAFSLAVGELSTHSSYSVWTPDQLVEQFLEEADCYEGQQK